MNIELRTAICDLIERLIDIVDALDGDTDFEDDDVLEIETDQDENPVTLGRDRAA